MKKWILVILIFSVLIGFIYLLIPNTLQINQNINVHVNERAFSRVFPNHEKWSMWWPGNNNNLVHNKSNYPTFSFKGNSYRILDKRLTSLLISINTGNDSLLSELIFIPSGDTTISLKWVAEKKTPDNPIERVQAFSRVNAIGKDMEFILQNLQKYYSSEKNIYGLEIKKELVKDSLLISSSFATNGYPSVEKIYFLVDRLKRYISKNGAKQTGLPMLNVTTKDSFNYYTKLAIPVNKKLKDSGDIVYRWMLGRGDILVTEVKGGTNNINKAFTELERYVTDYRRPAPAIPFQSLIIDRRLVQDTGKWITKIYWPVM